MELIDKIIDEVVNRVLGEGRYDNSVTPYNSRSDRWMNMGKSPQYVEIGNRPNNDVVSMVSTVDTNGPEFTPNGRNLCISDNKMAIYKVKNFGNDKIDSTMSLFGKGSRGEIELRKAIDTINGGCRRNRKPLEWRTITSDSYVKMSERSDHMFKTFWEFSLNGGQSWYILKPKPLENLQVSKLVIA